MAVTRAGSARRGWRFAAQIAVMIVAALGALALAQLGVDLLFQAASHGADTSSMTLGVRQIGDPWFALTLSALAAALVVIAVGSPHRWAQLCGVAVGATGTIVSAVGLVSGGGAGPAPAACWWVLVVVAGVATAGSTTARRPPVQAH